MIDIREDGSENPQGPIDQALRRDIERQLRSVYMIGNEENITAVGTQMLGILRRVTNLTTIAGMIDLMRKLTANPHTSGRAETVLARLQQEQQGEDLNEATEPIIAAPRESDYGEIAELLAIAAFIREGPNIRGQTITPSLIRHCRETVISYRKLPGIIADIRTKLGAGLPDPVVEEMAGIIFEVRNLTTGQEAQNLLQQRLGELVKIPPEFAIEVSEITKLAGFAAIEIIRPRLASFLGSEMAIRELKKGSIKAADLILIVDHCATAVAPSDTHYRTTINLQSI